MTDAWIEVLRRECDVTSQARVARKIGYTQATVSAVLKGTYPVNLDRVRAAVEGALMNVAVECPVLGVISRARCVEIQRRPFTPTNPANVALYRACRSGCAHSFLAQTVFPPPSVQPAVTDNTGKRGAVHAAVVPSAISHGVTHSTDRRKRSTPSLPKGERA